MKKYLTFLIYIAMAFWTVTVQAQSKTKTKSTKGTSSTKEATVSAQPPKKNSEELDSALAKLASKQEEINELTKSLAFIQNKVTSLENELKGCEKKLSADCPPCASQLAVPITGTIYKIQLGVFKNPDVSDNLTKQKIMGIEKVDDQFHYMLSYFQDYEECLKFIDELKRLGIQGATAVRYDNGERVVYDLTQDAESNPTPPAKPKPEAVKPATRPAAAPAKPATKPAAKPTPKPAPKSGAKPAAKPGTKPVAKSTPEKKAPVKAVPAAHQ